MIHSKFQSILPKNGQENGTETCILAKKMHDGENAFEVLLYLYKQCKHHTKDAFSVYKLIHLETCLICMERLIIYLHRNVNNSTFIKKQFPPEIRPAPPPLKSYVV